MVLDSEILGDYPGFHFGWSLKANNSTWPQESSLVPKGSPNQYTVHQQTGYPPNKSKTTPEAPHMPNNHPRGPPHAEQPPHRSPTCRTTTPQVPHMPNNCPTERVKTGDFRPKQKKI